MIAQAGFAPRSPRLTLSGLVALTICLPFMTIAPAGIAASFSQNLQNVAGSESSNFFAQASSQTAHSWRTAQLLRTIPETKLLPGTGNLIAVSPDNQKVATALSTDPSQYADAVTVWDLNTGRALYTVTGHAQFISAIAFSPNGQLLATADYNPDTHFLTIKLWDAVTGKRLRTLIRAISPTYRNGAYYHNAILAFSPDSQTLYSSATTPIIQVWNVNRGVLQKNLVGYRSVIRGLQVSPDGKTLASTHVDGKLSWMDLQTGRSLYTVTGGLDAFQVAFSSDGQQVMGSFTLPMSQTVRQPIETRQIGIWNVRTGTLVNMISGFSGEDWLVFSPDGKAFAVANYRSGTRLYDLATNQELKALADNRSTNVTFSPDGQFFVSATAEGIKIWH